MTDKRMYLTSAEAKAMNLPSIDEQLERYNAALKPRDTTKLHFLGSNPAGYSEWECTVCGVQFSLRWDGHKFNDKAISVDPWYCPYCY